MNDKQEVQIADKSIKLTDEVYFLLLKEKNKYTILARKPVSFSNTIKCLILEKERRGSS